MSYYTYSDPARKADPHAQPNVEIWEEDGKWFFAFGFPGCLRDSEPFGPYDTEAEVLDASQEF